MSKPVSRHLLSLPSEILHQILSYLSPLNLVDVSATCRLLHEEAIDDNLWHGHVLANLPSPLQATLPAGLTWRSIYLDHNPYWFLARGGIWISDSPPHGRLIIARYSHSQRLIEGYQLTAERGPSRIDFWSYEPNVMSQTFTPKIGLNLDKAVLRIEPTANRTFPTDSLRFIRELEMEAHDTANGVAVLHSLFMLNKPVAPEAINSQTAVWPPLRLPSDERVRNMSLDHFRSQGHRPSRLSEVSQQTFRIRRWAEFSTHVMQGVNLRVGENVETFATIPREAWTPTKEKPWRGIWVGDYSGHGCEFLVLLQPDPDDDYVIDLPDQVVSLLEMRERFRRLSSGSEGGWDGLIRELIEDGDEVGSADWTGPSLRDREQAAREKILAERSAAADASTGCDCPVFDPDERNMEHAKQKTSGPLFAVKITGDPNVPRAEYSFIVPDMGSDGTIRIAEEPEFAGARVVRSCAHTANTGFIEDSYSTSQLILASENRIAHYWEAFGHISFYERVDIDQFLRCD